MKKEVMQLREKMQANSIDVYYVPSGDFHSSEYVNDYFKTREFVSGLTGEAGELIVTNDGAYIWTDGRYFLQAETQLAGSGIELMRIAEPGVPTVEEFLVALAKKKHGYTLGFDGKVLPGATGTALKKQLGDLGVSLKTGKDLVDEIWTDRPAIKPTEIFDLPLSAVGYSAKDKIAAVRKQMEEKNADYLLITDLMECAWLLNLRANDIEYIPVFFSFIILGKDDIRLFVKDGALKNGKLPSSVDFVTIAKYDDINKAVSEIPAGRTLWLNSSSANYSLCMSVAKGVTVVDEDTPISMMKCIKNATEIDNEIRAHVKDGLAIVKFIHWIKGAINKEPLTEIKAADYLYKCRAEQKGFMELSFETISGYAENGAIIHYAPTPETDKALKPEGFLLVDSGGQYPEGTTDITRTIALGPLTQEMIDDYTYVLKSHIAMATSRLTPDMTGIQLDSIARQPMRNVGLDFKHGLSHGVGFMLACHEGPNVLRRVPAPCPIMPGMIMSNEPGVYIDHKFGVRIENLVLFKADPNGFTVNDPITFAPYEPKAINTSLLTDEELNWVNDYNELVRKMLLPHLDGELAEFVKEETAPLTR